MGTQEPQGNLPKSVTAYSGLGLEQHEIFVNLMVNRISQESLIHSNTKERGQNAPLLLSRNRCLGEGFFYSRCLVFYLLFLDAVLIGVVHFITSLLCFLVPVAFVGCSLLCMPHPFLSFSFLFLDRACL